MNTRLHLVTLEKEYLISNASDDVLGTIQLRDYHKKDIFPSIQKLFCNISGEELEDILSVFTELMERTAEWDKHGQSYYIAKQALRNIRSPHENRT